MTHSNLADISVFESLQYNNQPQSGVPSWNFDMEAGDWLLDDIDESYTRYAAARLNFEQKLNEAYRFSRHTDDEEAAKFRNTLDEYRKKIDALKNKQP